MTVAIISAVAAAGLFATASALQHRSAGLVRVDSGAPRAGLARFVVATARHPFWVAGSVADVAGLGLHAFALHDGPLTVVQPLLVSSVVFALPLRQVLEHQRPHRDELAWAVALTVGLVAFLAAATPSSGITRAPDPIPTAIAVGGVAAGMAVASWVGWRSRGERSAALLGVGAGIGFAAVAGLLKAVVDQLSRSGLGAVVTTWPLYGLLVAGGVALLLNQLAFEAAPLRASLPAINTVDPIISLIIGVAVFDEQFRRTPAALTVEVAGLAVMVVAVVALTRRDPTPRGGG